MTYIRQDLGFVDPRFIYGGRLILRDEIGVVQQGLLLTNAYELRV